MNNYLFLTNTIFKCESSVSVENAVKYDHLTHIQMLQEGLQVMDSTASSFCMDNNIPLNVFSIMEEGNMITFIAGITVLIFVLLLSNVE